MTEKEAFELGFEYTGISSPAWDTARWEKDKESAKQIKKSYKGADYAIVSDRQQGLHGTTLWKHIYGNEIFCKAQYFDPDRELDLIDNILPEKIIKIREEAEQKINAVVEDIERRKANYNYLMSIRKN